VRHLVELTLRDLGRAVAGLDQDISALGTESRGNSLRQGLDTSQESGAALDTELELLLHNDVSKAVRKGCKI
jgi:hypothetical protein